MSKGTTKKAPRENEKLKKPAKGGKNYIPNGTGLGGKREGSGRKKKEETVAVKNLTELIEAHAWGEIDISLLEKSTGMTKVVKKIRALALLDVLFDKGLNKKDVPSIKEYFDRTQGKARQSVEFSGEIKVDEQKKPTKAALAAAQAYEQES